MDETTEIIINNFHEDIKDIKKDVNTLQDKFDNLQVLILSEYVKEKHCKDNLKNISDKIKDNSENSLKKITIICTTISSIAAIIAALVTSNITK
jgi:ribosomal protein L1